MGCPFRTASARICGRKQSGVFDLRRVVNGWFYLVRAGCAWRYLPRDCGSWSTVYHCFRQFRRDGARERVHAHVQELARRREGCPHTTTVCCGWISCFRGSAITYLTPLQNTL